MATLLAGRIVLRGPDGGDDLARGATSIIRDRRRHGWFAVEKATTEAIRAHFSSKPNGKRLPIALAVYMTLCELANDARGQDVEQPRKLLATLAGVDPKTTSEYVQELEAARVLDVERRFEGGVNLPNVITLVDVERSAEVTRNGDQGERPPVEAPGPDGRGPTPPGSGSEAPLYEERPSDEKEKKRAHDPEDLPENFPDELAPHLDAVLPILREVAAAKGGIAVSRGAVARTIMARPRRPIVKAAHDFAAYFLGGRGAKRPQRDVVAGYRNWLDRENDLAAPELLPGTAPPGGLNPPADARQARRQRRSEALERVTQGAGT